MCFVESPQDTKCNLSNTKPKPGVGVNKHPCVRLVYSNSSSSQRLFAYTLGVVDDDMHPAKEEEKNVDGRRKEMCVQGIDHW